jgi:tricorn protease-like protein
MLHRTLRITLFALLAPLLAAASAAAAPADSGAVVFSQVTVDRTEVEGPEGEQVVKAPEGGLFAARRGRLNQLTENPGDVEPSFSSDGRKIAFVRDGDVWAMRADGTGQYRLTSGTEIDGRPRFAPNGRFVVFTRRGAVEGSPRDLYTVSARGGSPRALTSSPLDEHDASFAPDGRSIVFVGSAREANGGLADDLYSVRPNGAGQARLTRTGRVDEFVPRFFAGGIVYSRGQSGEGPGAYADVYTMRRDGSRQRPAVRGAGSAFVEDVAPNGRVVLFRRDQGLWLKRLGPKRARKLTQVADNSTTNAVFSSDGRKVAAFIAVDDSESLSIVDTRDRQATLLMEGYGSETGSVTTTIGAVMAWQPVPRARR